MRKHLKAWPRHSLTQYVPKYVKPWEPLKWCSMCFRMVPDGIQWYQMVPNAAQSYPILPNGNRWYPNFIWWYPMVPNGSQWYKMVHNGTKWNLVVPDDHQLQKWIYMAHRKVNLKLAPLADFCLLLTTCFLLLDASCY